MAPNGPIAYASRSLHVAEKKYSQLDKEGLAIIFGVKGFHQYLVGRHFTILSDHKPLQHLFQEHTSVPALASARLQRWALTLGAYDYIIQYKPCEDHANADVFSCLPLPDSPRHVPQPDETILALNMLQSLPITTKQIQKWTTRDPVLSKVRLMLPSGWENTAQPELSPYQQRQSELSLHDGCILWGSRVVIPPPGRERILDELHEGHPGISQMKTVPFRKGVSVYLGWTDADLCPVAAVLHYVEGVSTRSYLSFFSDGRPLIWECFVVGVRTAVQVAGNPLAHYEGHSF